MRHASLFLLLLIITIMSACSRPGDTKKEAQPSEGQDRLVLISPHPEPLLDEFENKFRKYYRGKFNREVRFDWLNVGGASDVLKFIHSEFAKNREGINVDLLWGGGTTPYFALKKNGFLETYKLPDELLRLIPQKVAGILVYDPDFQWYGSVLSTFGFVCNQTLLKLKNLSPPKTWKQLGDPIFAGAIGSADPRHSGSTYMIYSIILQAYGWEEGWAALTRMGANVRNFTAHSSDALKEVITGDTICSLSIDSYARAKINEFGKEKLLFILPEGLTVIDPDSIAILKGAPNQKVAEEFVSFVLSPAGQRLWLLPVGSEGGPEKNLLASLALLPSLYQEVGNRSVVETNPFEVKDSIPYNQEEANRLRNIINDMIGTLIIDIKPDLNRLWQKRIRNGMTAEFLKKLDEVPISKEKAFEYAAHWEDPVFRNRVINEWHVGNQKKIKELERLAE